MIYKQVWRCFFIQFSVPTKNTWRKLLCFVPRGFYARDKFDIQTHLGVILNSIFRADKNAWRKLLCFVPRGVYPRDKFDIQTHLGVILNSI
ncbi:MAG: hypothetical protein J6L81_07885, partial [Clostridia bacterium]|nr:hypothetical protein [Clostridia bacterium]